MAIELNKPRADSESGFVLLAVIAGCVLYTQRASDRYSGVLASDNGK